MLNLNILAKFAPITLIEENQHIKWPLKELSERKDLPESLAKSVEHLSEYHKTKFATFEEIFLKENCRDPLAIIENNKIKEQEKLNLLFPIYYGFRDTRNVSKFSKMKWIYSFPGFTWRMDHVSKNKDMNSKFIRDTLNDKCPFKPLTENMKVSWFNRLFGKNEIVEEDSNVIDWEEVTVNTNMQDILSNLDIPWSKRGLSKHKDMTLDILNELSSKLCFTGLKNVHTVISDDDVYIRNIGNISVGNIVSSGAINIISSGNISTGNVISTDGNVTISTSGRTILNPNVDMYRRCIKNKSHFKELRPEKDEFVSSYLLATFSKNDILRYASRGYIVEKSGIEENRRLNLNDKLEIQEKLQIKLSMFNAGKTAKYEELKGKMHFVPVESLQYNSNLTLSEYLKLTNFDRNKLDIDIIHNLSKHSDISREFDKSFRWSYNMLSFNQKMTSSLLKDLEV